VLEAARYTVLEDTSSRPLCCGRTFLSAGLVDEAREELTRLVTALGPHAERGVPIVGIEPSCLLTLRDELPVVVANDAVPAIVRQSVLLEELLAADHRRGALELPFPRPRQNRRPCCMAIATRRHWGTMPDVVNPRSSSSPASRSR